MKRQSSLFWRVLGQMTLWQKALTVVMVALMTVLIGLTVFLVWCGVTGRLNYASDVNYCAVLVADDDLVNEALLLDPGEPGSVEAEAFFWREGPIAIGDVETTEPIEVNQEWFDCVYRFKCSIAVEDLRWLQMFSSAPLALDSIYWKTIGVTGVGNFYIYLSRELVDAVIERTKNSDVEVCAFYAIGMADKMQMKGMVKGARFLVSRWERAGYSADTVVLGLFASTLVLAWITLWLWTRFVYTKARDRYLLISPIVTSSNIRL